MPKAAKQLIGAVILLVLAAGAAPGQSKPGGGGSLPAAYETWLNEQAVYIVSAEERELFLKLATDKGRDSFIEAFWKQRDPTPATRENEFKTEHYRRLAYANAHYAEAGTPGWKTESGRNYILFGDSLKPAGWRMKMSVIEGVRSGAAEPPTAVTSSSLRFGLTATLKTEVDQAEVLRQIEKTFNFASVRPLTEADFQWLTAKPEKDFQIFRLDGKEVAVFLTPIDLDRKLDFRLEVFEQGEKGKTSLLDTEFSAPEKTVAVFGFEDSKGSSYFLAFHMLGWLAETIVDGKPVRLPMAGQPPVAAGGDAVRMIGDLTPPKLLRMVGPVYPEIARRARAEGVVILEATTDLDGRVSNIKVLRSIPLLDQAAIECLKQWVYEPKIIDGKPRKAVFTVTVRFSLDEKTDGSAGETKSGVLGGVQGGAQGGVQSGVQAGVQGGVKAGTRAGASGASQADPVRINASGTIPKLITLVEPVYPEAARKARIEGNVILQVTIDPAGRVRDVEVLRSVPSLDQAAIDCVKQWVYEPVMSGSKAVAAAFTVTVRFALGGKAAPPRNSI